MKKKKGNLAELMQYAGKHKYLTYSSWVLSVISAALALVPFVYIFFIIKEVIEVAPDFSQATNIVFNGWMAVVFALASILIYVGALMCSHLSAFRIAGNMRKKTMKHISELPLGFICEAGSGAPYRKRQQCGDRNVSCAPTARYGRGNRNAYRIDCGVVPIRLAVRSNQFIAHSSRICLYVENGRTENGAGYESLQQCARRYE